jgi:hypothetical protein
MDTPGPRDFSLAVCKIDEVEGDASNFPVSTRLSRGVTRLGMRTILAGIRQSADPGQSGIRNQESGIKNQESRIKNRQVY